MQISQAKLSVPVKPSLLPRRETETNTLPVKQELTSCSRNLTNFKHFQSQTEISFERKTSMSKVNHEGLSLLGNSGRVTATSAVERGPEIMEVGDERTKRSEPMGRHVVELCLSGEDDDKMISKEASPPSSSRLVRSLEKLIHSLGQVIDALEGREGPKSETGAGVAPVVQKISGDGQDKEKSISLEPAAPSRPRLPPQRSDSPQFPTQSLRLGPIITSNHSTTLKPSSASKMSSQTPHRHGCPLCDKSFPTKRDLSHHLFFSHLSDVEKTALVEQGLTPACLFCHKKFPDNRTYRPHLVTHTGEKPFRCDQCGKQFARNSALKSHKRSHAPKAFECDECSKAFTLQQSLAVHKKAVHRKLKTFTCPHCPKKFSRKSIMVTHVNGVHLKVRHPCPHCEQTFTTKSGAWRHVKNAHPPESLALPSTDDDT